MVGYLVRTVGATEVSKSKKFGVIGVGVGFCLALLLAEFAYWANSHHFGHDLSLPYICLAPTSIILIATEKATTSAQVMVILVFAFSNALIYGCAFFVIGKIWVWFHHKSV